jgi:hypothetical protein
VWYVCWQPPASCNVSKAPLGLLLLLLTPCQAYESLQRGKRRAEERAARAADKAAKEESKRQEELRSYKSLMKVCDVGALGNLFVGGGGRGAASQGVQGCRGVACRPCTCGLMVGL